MMAQTITVETDAVLEKEMAMLKKEMAEVKQMLNNRLTALFSLVSAISAPQNSEWKTAKEFCRVYSIGSRTTLERKVKEELVEKNIEMFGARNPRYRLVPKQEETQ
jgi:c-di-GMP-related signal transduction protein